MYKCVYIYIFRERKNKRSSYSHDGVPIIRLFHLLLRATKTLDKLE